MPTSGEHVGHGVFVFAERYLIAAAEAATRVPSVGKVTALPAFAWLVNC
jgi:hypothetical protein